MPPTFPPGDLTGFPQVTVARGERLYRIVRTRDEHGNTREPWFFSSDGRGRWDLRAPHGTCYLSDRRLGAWLGVFRDAGLVSAPAVLARRLVTAARSGNELSLADLRAAAARCYGATLDLHTGDDYTLPHAWAAALHAAGNPGLQGYIRHDPAGAARNIALFAPAGPHTRLRGWRTSLSDLHTDIRLLTEVAPYGTGVPPIPYDVPITQPPPVPPP